MNRGGVARHSQSDHRGDRERRSSTSPSKGGDDPATLKDDAGQARPPGYPCREEGDGTAGRERSGGEQRFAENDSEAGRKRGRESWLYRGPHPCKRRRPPSETSEQQQAQDEKEARVFDQPAR